MRPSCLLNCKVGDMIVIGEQSIHYTISAKVRMNKLVGYPDGEYPVCYTTTGSELYIHPYYMLLSNIKSIKKKSKNA
jgi:hypothetical protein